MRRLRDERAFTVPELLVSMVVLAIVLTGFGEVLINSAKTSNRVEETAMLQNDARAAITRLTTDLRSATNTHDDQPVLDSTATTLTFDAPDRGTPFHLRRISYRVNGANLERSTLTSVNTGSYPWTWPVTPAAWTPEVNSLQNTTAVFTYYDASDNVTTTPAAVRSVRITLTVRARQNQAQPNTYSALVAIRTLQ